ncbi:MAG TPA: hypothetical protein VKE69_14265 [Planctomycetota bacterium]|nr:hypothetical protein [Planctomycetota bacterium]
MAFRSYTVWVGFALATSCASNAAPVMDDAGATIDLRVVDAESGRDVELDHVAWLPIDPDSGKSSFPVASNVAVNPIARQFHIECRPGPVEIHAWKAGFQMRVERLEAIRGTTSCTIRLEREWGFRVVLLHGERQLRPPGVELGANLVSVVAADSAEQSAVSVGSMTDVVQVSEPGLYDVWLRDLAGYRNPGAQRVRLDRGRVETLVFRLER